MPELSQPEHARARIIIPEEEQFGSRGDELDPASEEDISVLDDHEHYVEAVARKCGLRKKTVRWKLEEFMSLGFDRDEATSLMWQEIDAGKLTPGRQ